MITLDPRQLDVQRLALDKERKGITFSLLIPARGRAAAESLGDIIESIRKMWMETNPVIDEIGVLIDPDGDGRTYGLQQIAMSSGATWAVLGRDVPLQFGDPAQEGKGGAMRRLALLAMGSRLIFHDADLRNYDPMTVGILAAAAVSDTTPLFVNGSSPRLTGNGTPGGRTTEMVRSIFSKQLRRHVPAITDMVQPLIGEFVVDASLFASLSFSSGYGVETSLKILAMDAIAEDQFVQVALPTKHQSGQDYLDLVKQFHEISVVVDILEQYFLARWSTPDITPQRVASEYELFFPDRTLEPLQEEPLFQSLHNEIASRRWNALQQTRARIDQLRIHA
jgi:hypothetical protein